MFKRYLWVDVSVLVLSVVAVVLSWMYFVSNVILIASLQGSLSASEAWESLSMKDKLHFFSLWEVVGVLGNLFQIFGSLMSLIDTKVLVSTHEILNGIGCWFAWFNLVRYFDQHEGAFTIINTIKRAFPMMVRYMIGVLPIFMGYVFFGITLFWKSRLFSTITAAVTLLYAVVNNDSVLDSIKATEQVSSFWGQLYMISFTVFFICCVQNIFLAIIQDGFISLKTRPIKNAYEEDDSSYRPEISRSFSSPGVFQRLQSEKRSRLSLKRIISEEWRSSSAELGVPLLEDTEKSVGKIDRLMNRLHKRLNELVEISHKPNLTSEEQLEVSQSISAYLEHQLPYLAGKILTKRSRRGS